MFWIMLKFGVVYTLSSKSQTRTKLRSIRGQLRVSLRKKARKSLFPHQSQR